MAPNVNLLLQCPKVSCPEAGVLRPIPLSVEVLRQLRERGKTKARVPCPRCGTAVVLSLPEVPAEPSQVRLPEELGHLISSETGRKYPLRLGRNVIGKGSANKPADISLESNDPHLSRQHCVIEVRLGPTGRIEYLISDSNGAGDAPLSLNGTFIKERQQPLQPVDRFFLEDGDHIRLGMTQLQLLALRTTFEVPAPARNPSHPPTQLI